MIQQKMERWTKEIYSRGRTEGREEGISLGAYQNKLQIATVLKARGMDASDISDITGLSIEDIERLSH